jgi:hypothetical protein
MKSLLTLVVLFIAGLSACKEINPPACEELKQGSLTIQNKADSTYVVAHYIDSNIAWIILMPGEEAQRDVPAGTLDLIAKGKKRKEQVTTVPQCGSALFIIQ